MTTGPNDQFVFTDEMIRKALLIHGYYDLWHKDNWVSPDATNPDYAGAYPVDQFKNLLKKLCLI